MSDSQLSEKSSLGFFLWIPLGLLMLYFMLPALLTWWPPLSVERRGQRQKVLKMVEAAGG